jgi:hypothetical protein
MYFCIRDDDTSYFTTPEALEAAYGEITRWGPVSLAVIPYCRAGFSKGVPEHIRGRWSVHPLHQNESLVKYLRRAVYEKRFEIMLHGHHHDEPTGKGEFLRGKDLWEKVRDGRQYLEDLLGTSIRVFVPPKNIIGRDGLRSIIHARLDLGGTVGVRHGWPLLSRNTWKHWLMLRKWSKRCPNGLPWILDLGDHREIAGHAVTPTSSLNSNKAAFEAALNVGGTFCAATHYWEFPVASKNEGDPTVQEHLGQLVELARSNPQVRWLTVGDAIRVGAVLSKGPLRLQQMR